MLSRKEFFKDLLFRGIRTVNSLSAEVGNASEKPIGKVSGFDLPSTELSPSLLAIEAELRGMRLESGNSEELQREVYAKLVQNRPSAGPEEPR